jgi:RNA polymerase sigma factor (sigma-70 family)
MASSDDQTDSNLQALPQARALADLGDDLLRTGDKGSASDVDRAAERHGLSLSEHAELFERAAAAGYIDEDGARETELPPLSADRSRAKTEDLDSFAVFLEDVGRYPLLDAKQEIEFARAIEAGERATECRDGTTSTAVDRLIERGLVAKRRLVACNVRLVIATARGFRGQGLDFPDLVQAGTLGLIRAAEKFDWKLGFKFSTYATWWIRQSMARQLADTGRLVRLPVHVVERLNRLRRETLRLEQRLGREPSVSELADALHWEPAEIAFLRDVAQDPLSLDAPLASKDAVVADLVASTAPDGEQAALAATLADDVHAALEMLEPREREVLTLRYGLDGPYPRTLDEVGRHFSITRERVRQIEKVAKERLEAVLVERGYGPE